MQLEADPDVRIERESRIFDFDAQKAELPGGRHAAVDRDVREAQLRRGAVRREEESVAVDAEGQIEQHIGADVDLAGQLDHVAERQRIEQSLAAHAEIDDAIEALGHLNTEGRYAARLGQRDVARRLVQRVQAVAQVACARNGAADLGKVEAAQPGFEDLLEERERAGTFARSCCSRIVQRFCTLPGRTAAGQEAVQAQHRHIVGCGRLLKETAQRADRGDHATAKRRHRIRRGQAVERRNVLHVDVKDDRLHTRVAERAD